MRPPLFDGSGVALVTPFRDGSLHEPALRRLVAFHLEAGTDALVVNGSTGEAPALSAAEQQRAVQIVVAECEHRIPVIAGIGGSDTAAVAKLAGNAADAGADALLLSPPPYNKPTQGGIIAHFRMVLGVTGLPLIIYNVPGRTACNILPETVAAIAEDERVLGVKEASGDISQIAELARLAGSEIALYSGNDDQVVPLLALGGRGVISVVANVTPGETSKMVDAFLSGDVDEARKIQLRLLPLIRLLSAEPNPVPVKAAVNLLGYDAGEPRLPLLPASDQIRDKLREEMRALQLPLA